ncbi:hypothetical protein THAOC_23115 [Thalassiosira oceanica]|uniref:B30.2/SPRY domain-containing protein n=1 Tax=Thalassiosira oceanica TaxID=159749 RepID=K0RWR3_THAOC|nr:hypothetical protein THAOC_23115 [Thalassiosira oceanica]|eukprot:EJK56904.1 hypothetical protein THAOC_23115 [Thalassiosira oceanica]
MERPGKRAEVARSSNVARSKHPPTTVVKRYGGAREELAAGGGEPRPKKSKVDEYSSGPLLSMGSDLLTRCASYLAPIDMVQLGRTGKRFGHVQPGCQRSFVKEAAHQEFLCASECEQEALPKYEDESDVKLYRELLSMRQDLAIAWAAFEHSDLQLIRDYVLVHVHGNCDLTGAGYDSDVDNYFTGEIARLLRNETISSVRSGGCDVHCCAYSLVGGGWYSTNWGETYIAREDWPGMEDMQENGEMSMLLDYGAGTLTIYKNNRRLGIVQEGLAGEYSWMVSLGTSYASISIESLGALRPI